ncbi:MAG: RhuM family protein [Francisellaceae bacterium]
MTKQSNIVIYQSQEGDVDLQVSLDHETVWLTQQQMSSLFSKNVRTISEHIMNIFKEGELDQNSVIRKSRITAQDGKEYTTSQYNLDVIISVGYRVKSKEGTQFRIWATKVLRDHVIKGYTLNQKRLAENGFKDLEQSLSLIQQTLLNYDLVTDIGKDALRIVTEYAKSWRVLLAYDEDQLMLAQSEHQPHNELTYEQASTAISMLKENLIEKGEASSLFGNDRNHGLAGILGNIEQTFGGELLYTSIEEKAANLLYFIIKDHPFTDGNKRIACLIFIAYLSLQGIDFGLNENGMVALALLTAESNPDQKDLMVKLITNLIGSESKGISC